VKNSSVCTVKAGEKDAGSAGCWPGSRRCCRAGDMHQGTRRCRRSLRAFTAWSLPIGPSVFGYTLVRVNRSCQQVEVAFLYSTTSVGTRSSRTSEKKGA
jgi:hypothetical protein